MRTTLYATIAALGLLAAACQTTTTATCAQGGPFGSCIRYADEGGAVPQGNEVPGSTGSVISGVR